MSTVLIIEDEPLIRENVSEVLMYEGYEVYEADCGNDGVQLAIELMPDLVICDIMMPDMDGYKVLKGLATHQNTAAIPFIFLTAKSDYNSIRHGMTLGADDYLTKPFSSDELLAAVSTRLQKHAAVVEEYDQKVQDMRRTLAYVLPHEFRTPLSGILGYADLLKRLYAVADRDEILDMAKIIYHSGKRLERTIENNLFHTQLMVIGSDAERLVIAQRKPLPNPADVIEVIALDLAEQSSRSGDIVLDMQNVMLHMSKKHLEKLIWELIDNALKFSRLGSKVTINAQRVENTYVIEVTDQGRGMSAEQVASIDAYNQFERQRYEQQGLGLGLFIARNLAELYDGTLHIRSQIEHGTQVSVVFPLSTNE